MPSPLGFGIENDESKLQEDIMTNIKLKSSLIALTLGLGMSLSGSVYAGYNLTAQQCAALEEACEESASNCRSWFAVAQYCQGIMH